MAITINETAMQSLFTESEFSDFKGVVKEVCEQNPEIQGVVITGSLTQKLRLPDPQEVAFINKYDQAYSLIENKGRRRIYPSRSSDLDVWVCLKDPDGIGDVKAALESRAIELLCWLADNQDKHQSSEWIERKKGALNAFYKQVYMYSAQWNQQNPNMPWRGHELKSQIIQSLQHSMPDLVARINHHFDKKVPGEFFELRAYPESTFNLRVEEIFVDGSADKTPFPFVLERLLDMERNCFLLYVSDQGQERMIYPLNENGERLGNRILDLMIEQ